jgi:hypothetical protein
MDLTDLLQGQLSEGLLEQLTNQLGGANKQQTQAAAGGIMETLVTALAKNAATPDGASALNNALENDHDGSIFDSLDDFLGGNTEKVNPRTANGSGILNHILGEKQGGAIDMISKMSGLDSNKTGSLMATLAPIVMGALGKTKKTSGLDVGGLVSMLSGVVGSRQNSNNPMMGMITSFLDKDGDGSFIDDVAEGIGGKLLGKLFGRK